MISRTTRPSAGGSSRSRPKRASIGEPVAGLEPLEARLLLATDVLTYHDNNARTDANLTETTLTPKNVNINTFGKLAQVTVDGEVFAQPLVKTNVRIPGKGIHNVVYVATENDSLYAFDANTLALLWHDSFIDPAAGITPEPSVGVDIAPTVGITSTPVINAQTNTMYVVGTVQVTSNGVTKVAQLLHAIDLGTGQEKLGGPVLLQATVPGDGSGSVNGEISYDPAIQNQRPALLLENGVVYIASSSHVSVGDYHGWVLGYSASTLQPISAFNDTPNGEMGGIWMGGGGPAGDAYGNVYVATGNGTFQAPRPNGNNFGDSVVKLSNGGQLVTDFFTPSNQLALDDGDLDLGSGGVMLLPDQPGPYPHLMVAAGKTGTIYLINRDDMGQYSSTTNNDVQTVTGELVGSYGTPSYFNGTIYYAGSNPRTQQVGPLQAYSIVDGKFVGTPTSGTITYGYPGANPAISANGTKNGIVWTINGNDITGGPAILTAYNAANITQTLYSSEENVARDSAGTYNKFSTPTIANGKVYVQGNGSLTLYGLLPRGRR